MPSLPMPRPYTHPKTGVYWLRLRVPRDLRHAVGKGEIKAVIQRRDLMKKDYEKQMAANPDFVFR